MTISNMISFDKKKDAFKEKAAYQIREIKQIKQNQKKNGNERYNKVFIDRRAREEAPEASEFIFGVSRHFADGSNIL